MPDRDNRRRAHCQAPNEHSIYRHQIHIDTNQFATTVQTHTDAEHRALGVSSVTTQRRNTNIVHTHSSATTAQHTHDKHCDPNPMSTGLVRTPPLPQETTSGQQARNTRPRHPTHNTRSLQRPSAAQRHHQRHQRSGRGASSERAGWPTHYHKYNQTDSHPSPHKHNAN